MAAIPFITLDTETGTYRVNADALAFLANLSGPIGVVSIAGRYRTGKSTFLNRVLLDAPPGEGFGVGSSVNACTKGIWLYNRAFQYTGEHGVLQVLVVDSEGLGSLEADQTRDCQIFSLLLLLSSMFVYNSVGCIDEPSLNLLSLVTNVSEQIKLRSDTPAPTADLASVFPTFCWVIRDFTLDLEDADGRPMTAGQYLERALAPHCPTRDTIRECFADRMCLTMSHPDQATASFDGVCARVRADLFRRIRPLTYTGQRVSGKMLSAMAESFTLAVNNGATPVLQDSWSMVAGVQAAEARSEAVGRYQAYAREWVASSGSASDAGERLASLFRSRAAELERFRLGSMQCTTAGLDALGVMLDAAAVEVITEHVRICSQAASDLALVASSAPDAAEMCATIDRVAAGRAWLEQSIRDGHMLHTVCAWLREGAGSGAGAQACRAELEACRAELGACRAELETCRAELETRCAAGRAELARHEKLAHEQQLELRRTAETESELRAALGELADTDESLRLQVQQLEARVAEDSTLRLELVNTQQLLDLAEQATAEYEARAGAQREEFAEQLSALRTASAATVDTLVERVQAAEQEVRAATLSAGTAADALALLEARHDEVVEGHAAELQRQVEETGRQAGAREQAAAAHLAAIRQHEGRAECLQESLDAASSAAEQLRGEVDQLTASLSALERERDGAVADVATLKRRASALAGKDDQRKRMKVDLHSAQADTVKFKHVAEWLERDKQVRDDRIRELSRQVAVLQQKYTDAVHRHDMEVFRLSLDKRTQATAHTSGEAVKAHY
jgi:hypothetical protein